MVHQMFSKPTASARYPKKSRLDVCTTCRQVLNASDLQQHQISHTHENDFPSLSNGLSNNSWTKKWHIILNNNYLNNFNFYNIDVDDTDDFVDGSREDDNDIYHDNMISNRLTCVSN